MNYPKGKPRVKQLRREVLREKSNEELLTLHAFFGHPKLREHYTGMLADILCEAAGRTGLTVGVRK